MRSYTTEPNEYPTTALNILIISNPKSYIRLYPDKNDTLVAQALNPLFANPGDVLIISNAKNPVFTAIAIGMVYLHNLQFSSANNHATGI